MAWALSIVTRVTDSCAPGFMSHLLTVLKAYSEVEEPAWRLYDIAYLEKMAAMGLKSWLGMDVKLYQEVCGGCPCRTAVPQADPKGAGWTGSQKRPLEGRRPAVCWQFNDGGCTLEGDASSFTPVRSVGAVTPNVAAQVCLGQGRNRNLARVDRLMGTWTLW